MNSFTGSECIHCGFCLETCPTYVLTGREEESPRGRILLAGALESGRLVVEAPSLAPIDHCLGCLACETACPSGVPYRTILEGARSRAAAAGLARSRLERWLLREIVSRPSRMQWAAGIYRALRLRPALHVLARIPLLPRALRARASLAPVFESRGSIPSPAPVLGAPRVWLFRGCAARVLFPSTEEAMVALLVAAGYRVDRVDTPVCCGALAHHAGDVTSARAAARAIVKRFAEGGERIIPSAAGCGAHLKDLFQAGSTPAAASRVRDLAEALLEGPRPLRFQRDSAGVVAYQDPCHLRHAQAITEPPRRLLRAAGAELREPEEADLCCGSAGSYHLASPETSAHLGRRKRDALLATGARTVVTANPGCWIQLRAQWPGGEAAPRIVSLARFLAERLEPELVAGGTDQG